MGNKRIIRRYWVDEYNFILREWSEDEYKNNNPNEQIYSDGWEFYCPICKCSRFAQSYVDAKESKILHRIFGCPFGETRYRNDIQLTCCETGTDKANGIEIPYFKSYK